MAGCLSLFFASALAHRWPSSVFSVPSMKMRVSMQILGFVLFCVRWSEDSRPVFYWCSEAQ
jgi:hypothetical protein